MESKNTEADGKKRAGRDPATGKFIPGNQAAKGRGPNRERREALSEFRSLVTSKHISDVYHRMLGMILDDGDVKVLEIWLSHVLGKPETQIELTAAENWECDIDETFL